MEVYIRFWHEGDVELLQLSPRHAGGPYESYTPLVCGRCGETNYISVELPESWQINQPMGELVRPLPRELPYVGGITEPRLPTLRVSRKLDQEQRIHLKYNNRCVVAADDDGFDMSIAGFSFEPVKHTCADLRKDEPRQMSDCEMRSRKLS